jgi:FMN hydrolase / 5-amino-6-(5-phospho-D-ribitylamino)uracil phosphatase
VIRVISFDADQTLWDFRGVMQRALARTVEEICRRYPQIEIDAAELQEIRHAVAEGYRGRPHSLGVVREESFRVALERHGVDPAEAALVATDLLEHYMTIRFSEIELYDDVRPALAGLRNRYRLALISNGNTDPDRSGLPNMFDAVVLGPDHGIEKPNPLAFQIVSGQLAVATTEMVHVGDDADDVIGANGVGAVSVLLDRGDRDLDPELREAAGFVIKSLSELPAVLASVG